MKKVFISGPVTGLDYEVVKTNFNEAEQLFLDKGFQVMNPVSFVPSDSNWSDAMRKCLVAISKCDAIYLLDGFQNSKGSLLELTIAQQLELEMMFQDPDMETVFQDDIFDENH